VASGFAGVEPRWIVTAPCNRRAKQGRLLASPGHLGRRKRLPPTRAHGVRPSDVDRNLAGGAEPPHQCREHRCCNSEIGPCNVQKIALTAPGTTGALL
jgi:hypothetical protein